MSKLNSNYLYVGLLIAGSLSLPITSAQQSTTSDQLAPAGWYVYPSSKLENAGPLAPRCFNNPRKAWKVTKTGGHVEIADLGRPKKRQPQAALPMPPRLTLQPGMPGRSVDAGLGIALHIGNQWLLGYDAGEWGGGLWLTNDDGSDAKRIVDENVHGVIPVDAGFLVLSGVAHMSLDSGKEQIFSKPNGLNMALKSSADLEGAPRTFAEESDGNVLVVTTGRLVRVTHSGELLELARFPKWVTYQYANSMVILPDGNLFIGMRMFVLKLHPNSNGYTPEWLLPNECQSFHLTSVDCVCTP
jgi:hypothetical protein